MNKNKNHTEEYIEYAYVLYMFLVIPQLINLSVSDDYDRRIMIETLNRKVKKRYPMYLDNFFVRKDSNLQNNKILSGETKNRKKTNKNIKTSKVSSTKLNKEDL